MDKKSKERFEEIVNKEPAALSQGDIDFLKARRSYLTSDQREKFVGVLGEPKQSEPAEKKKSK